MNTYRSNLTHGNATMSMMKKLIPLVVLGTLGSTVFSAERAAVATPAAPVPAALASGNTPAAAADLSTTYAAIAAAKVKAEVSLSTLGQLIDARANGLNDLRGQIDVTRQNAMGIYSTFRNDEEAKGEQKNISFITTCLSAHTKIDTATTLSNQERSVLDQKIGMASEQFNTLRNAYNSTENLERALKEARLDLTAVERVYQEIDTKAKAIDQIMKESLEAYATIGKTWTAIGKEADDFTY